MTVVAKEGGVVTAIDLSRSILVGGGVGIKVYFREILQFFVLVSFLVPPFASFSASFTKL